MTGVRLATLPTIERLIARTVPEPNTGCLLWLGFVNENGYGMLYVAGRNRLAHRTLFALSNGPIPDDICVLHRCDTPICVNPEHLFLGTQADNVRDKVRKGRMWGWRKTFSRKGQRGRAHVTQCQRGHARTLENSPKSRQWKWECMACKRDRDRARNKRLATKRILERGVA